MKTIAFIIPYFGKSPNSFPIFWESCGINSDIDFFIFTDDETDYDYPSNVVRIKSTLQVIKERAQLLFDFPISLHVCTFPEKTACNPWRSHGQKWNGICSAKSCLFKRFNSNRGSAQAFSQRPGYLFLCAEI